MENLTVLKTFEVPTTKNLFSDFLKRCLGEWENDQLQISLDGEIVRSFKRAYLSEDETQEDYFKARCYFFFVVENNLFFQPTKENKYHVDDYPYGYTKRCQMFWWIEQGKSGTRLCRQSLYNGRYNKPKKSTYDKDKLCYLDINGHLQTYSIGNWSSDKNAIDLFYKKAATVEDLTPYTQKLLDVHNGNDTHKTSFSFSTRIDKTLTRPSIKVTFDGEKILRLQVLKAIIDDPNKDKLFAIDGGYRVFAGSREIGFFDKEVFDNYSSFYAHELDPFADKIEGIELMRFKSSPRKLPKPVSTEPRTKEEFSNKYTYMTKEGSRVRLVSRPKPNKYGRYYFTFENVETGKRNEYSNPFINEEGFLKYQYSHQNFSRYAKYI